LLTEFLTPVVSAAAQVLKKSVIKEKGQVEHTMSERSILCEVRHPFIVRLRFAFQSEDVSGFRSRHP
jgi:serine/threonine protein kinase